MKIKNLDENKQLKEIKHSNAIAKMRITIKDEFSQEAAIEFSQEGEYMIISEVINS